MEGGRLPKEDSQSFGLWFQNYIQRDPWKGKPWVREASEKSLRPMGRSVRARLRNALPLTPANCSWLSWRIRGPSACPYLPSRWPGGRGHRSTAWLYGDDSAVCWSMPVPAQISCCLAMGRLVRCKGGWGLATSSEREWQACKATG